MLGWNIAIYRQENNEITPATFESPVGQRLAIWQTGLGGLDWIEGLVKEGKVTNLGGNGYPLRYTATVKNILPIIMSGPPSAKTTWSSDEGDVLLSNWEGKTVLDRPGIKKCNPDEWLLIEAFDES